MRQILLIKTFEKTSYRNLEEVMVMVRKTHVGIGQVPCNLLIRSMNSIIMMK